MQKFKFDHESETLTGALGIEDQFEVADKISDIVIEMEDFPKVSPSQILERLLQYDDPKYLLFLAGIGYSEISEKLEGLTSIKFMMKKLGMNTEDIKKQIMKQQNDHSDNSFSTNN